MLPEILFEDNHLIAVNKTNHDLVQKDSTGDTALDDSIRLYIKEKLQKPGNVFLGVIHRLDRPVSGIVMFARTSKALSRMNELFRNGDVKKTYWAIVKNPPINAEAELSHYMTRNTKQNKSYCYESEVPGSKLARLDYRVIANSDNYHLIEVNLLTGRHHQIRAQLAHIGSPIKGDLKYGFPRSNKDGGISLHSRKIEFSHIVSHEKITIEAPPPENEVLWNVLIDKIKDTESE
jgi:23S rRNA pseudouridine1911/1915/1917 synthase